MQQHPIILLIQKVESCYSKDIQKYFAIIKKQRTEKLYKLLASAKNEEQLGRSLLFKKLFGKTYSEKNDYLWRNEIRLLKETIESFLIQKQHEYISKHNEAYNQWLLVQMYDKMKYLQGVTEQTEILSKEKHEYASYPFALDAQLIMTLNLQHSIPDVAKRMEAFPPHIEESIRTLKDLFATYCSRINLSIALHNWLCYNTQTVKHIEPITAYFEEMLAENNMSTFYNHFSNTFSTDFDVRISNINKAIEAIEPIAQKNKLQQENNIIIQMALGRELSANGHFPKAHEIFTKIKKIIDEDFQQHRTVFYVNYVTNLVKNRMYKEALYVMVHEFSTDNLLYKNMLLQNRLLCYLYLRDTLQLEKFINYDLDTAPFPQNYMLKVIKSAYFYLIKEYDTAISIINSLLNAKYAADNMQYYQPVSNIYKKLYTISQKNSLQKKWSDKDIKSLLDGITEFEKTSPVEFKKVSVYLWLKEEIENNLVEKHVPRIHTTN